MEKRIITTDVTEEDFSLEGNLRPQTLDDYIGQEKTKSTLKVYIEAAKQRHDALDHVLFYGPPGLGKTTLSGIIANEMGVHMKVTSGPAIEKPGEMAAILNNLQEGDILVAVSDGCPHAGIGVAYNFGWQLRDIADFVATASVAGYNAKTLSTMLIAECDRLYGGKPGDDATACVVRVRRREPVNIAFGPPRSREDDARMMTLFFSKGGKHVICGGTTAAIASQYLGTPITTELKYSGGDVPPIGHMDGVDLVTEGIITVSRVIDYAKDMLEQNERHEEWDCGHDGASLISRMLFEEATDINFFVGRAVNPAHQDPNLPISFHIKMKLVEELSELLREMGKRVKVMYF